jgi:hypothetical protein
MLANDFPGVVNLTYAHLRAGHAAAKPVAK